MTRVPRTARIRDVNSVMFVNRIREMVSFEHGEETEKDVFSSGDMRGSVMYELRNGFRSL